MESTPLSRQEFNFLTAINRLESIIDAQNKKQEELKGLLSQKEADLAATKTELTAMKRQLEFERNATLESSNRHRETVEKLKNRLEAEQDKNEGYESKLKEFDKYKTKTADLEKEITAINKRNDYAIELKKATNMRLEKKNEELRLENEQLKREIQELESEFHADSDDDIISENNHELIQMPMTEDDYEPISNNNALPSVSPIEKTKHEILQAHTKYGDRIPESLLQSIPNVVFEKGGVIKAKGGTLTLHRNFLNPSYRLVS